MAEAESGGGENSIQVTVRVRPLNDRERDEGHRTCVTFDDASSQVVLEAVDKNTLFQLRGATAKGYAFDKRFGQDETAETIYNACVAPLVEKCFQGYNATVMAYGQTGSGKTHTMTGGVGIFGLPEEGICLRVIKHIFQVVEALNKRAKPGEGCTISASSLELYNEELRDLATMGDSNRPTNSDRKGWDSKENGGGLKLQERPVGNDGRVVPEVVGLTDKVMHSAKELLHFYDTCQMNRSTSATKLNDRSSRSHAIFTINIKRLVVTVVNDAAGKGGKTKMRTDELASKFHLVDLAGSERVKRSGVTGKELKEATHINSGLLALGNVIQALATEGESGKKAHIPYRDSKLTRLLQDSLGGNSMTVIISCISPSEADFEETNNTLKYANRACKIKNTALPNKYMSLEEDLLPMIPQSNGNAFSLMQLQQLLEEHGKLKEMRERRNKEKQEKEEKKLAALASMKEGMLQKPGYQRIRANHYDELRKQIVGRRGARASLPNQPTIDTIEGIRRRDVSSPDLEELDSLDSERVSRATTPLGGDRGDSTPRLSTAGSMTRKKTDSPINMDSPRNTQESPRMASDSPRNTQESPQPASSDSSPAAAAPAPAKKPVARKPIPKAVATSQELPATAAATAAAPAAEPEPEPMHEEAPEPAKAEPAKADAPAAAKPHVVKKAPAKKPAEPAPAPAPEPEPVPEPEPEPMHEEPAPAAAAAAAKKPVAKKPAPKKPAHAAAAHDEGDPMEVESHPAQDATVTVSNNKTKFKRQAKKPDEEQHNGADEPPPAAPPKPAPKPAAPAPAPERPVTPAMDQYDAYDDDMGEPDELDVPKLLARFKVNQHDTLSVFKANTKEDFKDVISLLPENTPLPASDKMTYLLARLELKNGKDLNTVLQHVAMGEATMNEAVGPAVGCLMATFGTNMIASCIFDFDDPPELELFSVDERIELWGLQIPHNSVRPTLQVPETSGASDIASEDGKADKEDKDVVHWTSVDRLQMSIGLLYALCNHAIDNDVRCGFCVPRPQLLRRWLQAGVKMKQITGNMRLIYPPTAHDYDYYKTSTVAYFMVEDVKEGLQKVLGLVH